MIKYIALKSLYFLNGTKYLHRGKLYNENVYNTAKTLLNLQLKFRTDQLDEIVSFSDNPESDMYIDKILQDYDKYKAEHDERQDNKK